MRTGGVLIVATNMPNHQRDSIDLLVLGDVEVHQLVVGLASCNHTDVVTKVLLLQVLLGEVLGRKKSSEKTTLRYLLAKAQETVTLTLLSLLETAMRSPRLFTLLSTLMCSARNFSYKMTLRYSNYEGGNIHDRVLHGGGAVDGELDLLSRL